MIPLEFKLIAGVVLLIGLWAGVRHEINAHDDAVKAGLLATQAAQQAVKDKAVQAAQAEISNEAQRMAMHARDDALVAVDSHQRLSERFTAALGNGIAPHGAGPSASAPGDLPADVFRRIDEAAGQLAIAADDSYIAGLSCERKYDALNK